ncbi:MAG: hypothetical protein U7126_10885 [Microcoleus sp.]
MVRQRLREFSQAREKASIAEGSSARDFVTHLMDVRKFGKGFCNAFNGCQEVRQGIL